MKFSLNPLFAAVVLSASLSVQANDFGANPKTVAPAGEEVSVEQMVVQANQAPNQNDFKVFDSRSSDLFFSVENELTDYQLQKGWSDNYTPGKFRLITVATASVPVTNPKTDPRFLEKRAQAATTAMLTAKANIIKTIRTRMSASDQLIMPGSPIREALNAELTKLEDQLATIQYEAEELQSILTEEEQQQLQGVDWTGRREAFVDAVIKKIDASYDPTVLDNVQASRIADLKIKLGSTLSLQDEITQRAEALKGNISSESVSSVAAIASMPLYGTVTLATEEAWDKNSRKYEVGVIVAWSQKHEARTRAILTGNRQGKALGGNNLELRQYIASQDAATMIGPSNFTDSQGVRWVIGSAAAEIRGSDSKRAKQKADLLAMKETAISLYSDVSSRQTYDSIVQEIFAGDVMNNETEAVVVESFSSVMRQAFSDRTVQGVSKVYSREIKHPITGKRTYVSVYAVSA
ncbi:hypothetical protein, partial [Endozoicomonas sp.]|uniref:hypothetical protein n=1 Tax=Endozoicomonas sp. TaxID=1892382 RepID=UPI00383B9084